MKIKKSVPIFSITIIALSCCFGEPLDDNQIKDFVSRMESLHSTLEKSIQEQDERTKELKQEQGSIRQKLNVQASHVRRLQDETSKMENELKQDILSAISDTTEDEPGGEPGGGEPDGGDDDNDDDVMEILQEEISKRQKLKKRVKSMEDNFFDLQIELVQLKMELNATKKMMSKNSGSKMRCESGVKSSGELESNEAKELTVEFTKPFASTPHVLVGASMAGRFKMESGAQVAAGAIDFHLRKSQVTPNNFVVTFTTSEDSDGFIFASWMACGKAL